MSGPTDFLESASNEGTAYPSIGTLDDEGLGLTCSFDAARRWGRARKVLGYPSFEAASDDLKRGRISAFLVPAAYPKLHLLIMDKEIHAAECFITIIPPLVLVGRDRPSLDAVVVYHHPATQPLLHEIDLKISGTKKVASNSSACTAVLDGPSEAMAITNGLAARAYRLRTHQVLRPALSMPFICFTSVPTSPASSDTK